MHLMHLLFPSRPLVGPFFAVVSHLCGRLIQSVLNPPQIRPRRPGCLDRNASAGALCARGAAGPRRPHAVSKPSSPFCQPGPRHSFLVRGGARPPSPLKNSLPSKPPNNCPPTPPPNPPTPLYNPPSLHPRRGPKNRSTRLHTPWASICAVLSERLPFVLPPPLFSASVPPSQSRGH